MSNKGHSRANESWQERIHEIEFTELESTTLKVLVDADKRELGEVLTDLAVDNNSIKVKSVEYFSSYTISYTLDKAHPKYPKHTFWFYHHTVAEGLLIMAAFVAEMLPDVIAGGVRTQKRGVW